MRGVRLMIALAAAGALVLGTGSAFAQQSPTAPSTSPPSAAATPKASGARQQKAPRVASEEKGEKEVGRDRVVQGPVTAVEASANPNTLVMQAKLGRQPATIGVDVPPTTKITEGKAKKSLSDIKTGDQVWMRYDRMSDRLVAEQIRILPAGSKAAKTGTREGAKMATPAAAKGESAK